MENLWDLHFVQDKVAINGKRGRPEPSSAFRFYASARLLSLSSHDLTTIVVAASLASSVGHNGFAALGADAHAGSGQLPVGTTTLVATSLGHFTLRDSHGDTSLVKLLFTAYLNLLV